MAETTRKPLASKRKGGVRERSKQERKHRILVAAREMFAEHGYDRATLRQIAAKAGVTVGALFKHVTDKRDLIHLIFNEDLDSLADKALGAPQSYQTFREKILSVTEHLYRHFGSDPLLSRVLLSEILVESPGLHLERNLSIRARFISGIQKLVEQAIASKEIQSKESPEFIALQIFLVHAAALRRWLNSSAFPQWRVGHRDYARFLQLQLDGLIQPPPQARNEKLSPKKRSSS